MRWNTVGALLDKDVRLYFRNRFFAFISVLSVTFFILIYWIMPAQVDEVLRLAVHAPGTSSVLLEPLQEEDALVVVEVASVEALREEVLDGDVVGGLALPIDLLPALAAGQRPTLQLYLPADAPSETREMLAVMVEGLTLGLADQPLALETRTIVLGPDLAGEQIPHRDRMLPLLAVLVLMVETLGLASLLSEEVNRGTVRALLATPMGVRELFLSKGLAGVGMSFAQALIVMALVGGLARGAPIILLTLLLGAILVTGIGFLMAAVARDLLGVLGVGLMVLFLLAMPPIGVIFPGTVTPWARLIPSHQVATVIHEVANLEAGWGDVWQPLAILFAVDLAFAGAGLAVLVRRFR